VDRPSRIECVGVAKRLSILVDGVERATRSNIQVHGGAALVGFE
jgi:hypothetical protein